MIKIAQNEETLNSFDEILDFKPSYLNDNPSLSAIRKKAQFFAIQIKTHIEVNNFFEIIQ